MKDGVPDAKRGERKMPRERSDEVQSRDRLRRRESDEAREEGDFRDGDERHAENADDGRGWHRGEARKRRNGAQAMEMPRRNRHNTQLRRDRDREWQGKLARISKPRVKRVHR